MQCLTAILFIQIAIFELASASGQQSRLQLGSNIEAVRPLQVNKRSAMYHNYIMDVFWNIISRNWLRKNCEVVYNCKNISSRHCKDTSKFYFSKEVLPRPCSIDFQPSIAKSDNITGCDLVLYKAEEPMASPNDTYELWLLLAESALDENIEIALVDTISASCSGWQMLHLDNTVMDSFLKLETNNTNFEFLVFKNDDYYSLTCDEVHSLFIFNTTVHHSKATNQMNNTTGERYDQNPFSKNEKEMKYFTPILNVFMNETSRLGPFKREVSESLFYDQKALELNASNMLSTTKPCEIRDHWVHVNSTDIKLESGEVISLLAPRLYNARRCERTESRECRPIKETFLTTLMERKQEGKRQVFKKISEYKIIEQCG